MTMDLAQLQQQLPQLEYYCERLYNAQVRVAWRVYAPQGWQRRSEGNVPCCRIRMNGPKQSNRSPRLRNPRIIYLIYGCVRAGNAASLPASPPSERDHVHQSCCGVQTILDASHNPYAQYFASSSLLKMVSEQSVRCAVSKFGGPSVDLTAHRTHYQPVCRPEIKMEIRNYFLGYLQRYILSIRVAIVTSSLEFVHMCGCTTVPLAPMPEVECLNTQCGTSYRLHHALGMQQGAKLHGTPTFAQFNCNSYCTDNQALLVRRRCFEEHRNRRKVVPELNARAVSIGLAATQDCCPGVNACAAARSAQSLLVECIPHPLRHLFVHSSG